MHYKMIALVYETTSASWRLEVVDGIINKPECLGNGCAEDGMEQTWYNYGMDSVPNEDVVKQLKQHAIEISEREIAALQERLDKLKLTAFLPE